MCHSCIELEKKLDDLHEKHEAKPIGTFILELRKLEMGTGTQHIFIIRLRIEENVLMCQVSMMIRVPGVRMKRVLKMFLQLISAPFLHQITPRMRIFMR